MLIPQIFKTLFKGLHFLNNLGLLAGSSTTAVYFLNSLSFRRKLLKHRYLRSFTS
jgi:hypothetical protein